MVLTSIFCEGVNYIQYTFLRVIEMYFRCIWMLYPSMRGFNIE